VTKRGKGANCNSSDCEEEGKRKQLPVSRGGGKREKRLPRDSQLSFFGDKGREGCINCQIDHKVTGKMTGKSDPASTPF